MFLDFMRIIIIGKRDTMGTTPNIRVKGVSRLSYNFLWDPKIRHYAYEPKDQAQVNDIFRSQGRVYRHIFFSAWLPEPETKAEVEEPKAEVEEPKVKRTPKKKVKKAVVADNR